eukprot:3232967-Rhodomonas_salina.1
MLFNNEVSVWTGSSPAAQLRISIWGFPSDSASFEAAVSLSDSQFAAAISGAVLKRGRVFTMSLTPPVVCAEGDECACSVTVWPREHPSKLVSFPVMYKSYPKAYFNSISFPAKGSEFGGTALDLQILDRQGSSTRERAGL